jgi:DNA-binding NarL/FixJ family response regulator
MDVIRIGVVAPVMAVRAGLRALASASPDLEVAFEAPSLASLGSIPPETDVILVTAYAGVDMELAPLLAGREGQVAVLLLSDEPQAAQGLPGLPLRAWGILSLDSTAEELAAAVRALAEGLITGSPALLQPLFPRLLTSSAAGIDASAGQLTEREIQVLQLLAEGMANKQVAVRLGISEHTVKFHVSSLYTKLGATNRTEAVRLGVQRGLVTM